MYIYIYIYIYIYVHTHIHVYLFPHDPRRRLHIFKKVSQDRVIAPGPARRKTTTTTTTTTTLLLLLLLLLPTTTTTAATTTTTTHKRGVSFSWTPILVSSFICNGCLAVSLWQSAYNPLPMKLLTTTESLWSHL